MPSPTPTEEQIEKTREVAGENSYSYVESKVNALNDSQWSRALDLHDLWDEYPADDVLAIEGGRDGVRLSSPDSRESVRKTMRLLLGLPEMRDTSVTGLETSGALVNCAVF